MEALILEAFILVLMKSGTKSHEKKLDQLKNIDSKFYCLDYYDVSVNKYGVKCGKS